MPSRRRTLPAALVAMASAFCWSTAAFAQATPAPVAAQPAPAADSDVRRLSDEERLAILDGITPESAAAARGEQPGSQLSLRNIHGEVGAAVGTNGMRAIYGTADIPLGDHAGATVSFESSRFGTYRR